MAVLLLTIPSHRPAAPSVATLALLPALVSRRPLPAPGALLSAIPGLLDDDAARAAVLSAGADAVMLLAVGLVATVTLHRASSGSTAARAAHGTARFATPAQLRAADLLSGEGVVLGCRRSWLGTTPLTDRSQDHVLLMMTTGAGKTTGPIASTLLNTLDTALVLDPKGELWNLTAGWRKRQGHHVVRFDPLGLGANCSWNPLDEIDSGEDEVAVISLLAENLVSYPATTGDTHWTASARSLLRCLVLHVLYDPRMESLAAARDLLTSGDLDQLFAKLATAEHDRDGSRGWRKPQSSSSTRTHPEVLRLAQAFGATPERERGSIVSTLLRFLDLWGDPRVAQATGHSDWQLSMLTGGRQPATVYVTVPSTHLPRMAPLVRVLVALLVHRVSLREVEGGVQPTPLMLLLDEFGALGRIPIMEDVLAFFRGYGVRAVLAVQDLTQLRRLYGPHHSISANCRVQVASASPDVHTRQEISRRLGESTWTYRKVSRSGRLMAGRRTTSQAEVRRPLLTEGEVGALPMDRLLVVKAGHPPVLAHKLPYWRHPELARRAEETAPKRPAQWLRTEVQPGEGS